MTDVINKYLQLKYRPWKTSLRKRRRFATSHPSLELRKSFRLRLRKKIIIIHCDRSSIFFDLSRAEARITKKGFFGIRDSEIFGWKRNLRCFQNLGGNSLFVVVAFIRMLRHGRRFQSDWAFPFSPAEACPRYRRADDATAQLRAPRTARSSSRILIRGSSITTDLHGIWPNEKSLRRNSEILIPVFFYLQLEMCLNFFRSFFYLKKPQSMK